MPQVTEGEREDVLALADKAMAWLDDKNSAQEALDLSAEPVFTSSEVTAQLEAVGKLVTRLARKPKPKPKPVVNATNATEPTNATEIPSEDAETSTTENADAKEEATDETTDGEEASGSAGGAAGDDEL